MSEHADVPGWPIVTIEMAPDAVRVDGQLLQVPEGQDLRQAAIASAANTARLLGRPVRVEALESDGAVFPLIVDADASVREGGPAIPPPQQRRRAPRRKRTGTSLAEEQAAPDAAKASWSPSAQAAARPTPAPAPVEAPVRHAPAPAPVAAEAPVQHAPALEPEWERTRDEPVPEPEPIPQPAPEPTPAFAQVPAPEPEPTFAAESAATTLLPAVQPEPAPQPASTASATAAPTPTAHQASRLQAIRSVMDAGDVAGALHMAAVFDAEVEEAGDPASAAAAREVHAYVALRAGAVNTAVRLFSAVALDRAASTEPAPRQWAFRLAQNAHYAWLTVTEPEEAYELSTPVLTAYSALGMSDGPARAALDRQAELRQQLIAS